MMKKVKKDKSIPYHRSFLAESKLHYKGSSRHRSRLGIHRPFHRDIAAYIPLRRKLPQHTAPYFQNLLHKQHYLQNIQWVNSHAEMLLSPLPLNKRFFIKCLYLDILYTLETENIAKRNMMHVL